MANESAPASVQAEPPVASPHAGEGTSKVPLHELLTERGKRQTAETELATVKPLAETYKQRAETAEAAAAAAQERIATYEAQEKAKRDALIESLPEADRPIAQAIADPVALSAFAERVGKIVNPAAPAPRPAAVPGATAATVMATAEEVRANSGKPGWIKDNFHRLPR